MSFKKGRNQRGCSLRKLGWEIVNMGKEVLGGEQWMDGSITAFSIIPKV